MVMKSWTNKDIVEGIGILGIIVSLIFVGLELRQNSAVARLEAHNSFITGMAEFSNQIAYDEEFSAMMLRTYLEPGSITQLENLRFQSFYRSVIYLWYGLYQSVEEDILSDQYLSLIGQGGLFNHPVFKRQWETLRPAFNEDFVVFFEGLPWNED
jgi:hypothetical protein